MSLKHKSLIFNILYKPLIIRVFAPNEESTRKYVLIFRGISRNPEGKTENRLQFESCLYCILLENESASHSNRIQTYEQHKRIEYTGHKPYKTAVGNGMREIIYELPPDAVEIIFLEDAVNAEMIAYKYCRYLALRHTVLTVPVHHTRHLAVMADADFFESSTLKFSSNSSRVQKISVTFSLETIDYIVCDYLNFNYKDTKIFMRSPIFICVSL